MIDHAKRLHALGFGIHWVRPKSKVPVESGWTKGPRHSWAALEKRYQASYNVGVRLGVASKIGSHYLAVIDCDVKSSDPLHVAEMEKELTKLISVKTPVVFSGRGNGSRHLYIKTVTPAAFRRVTQSTQKVRVVMPSVAPSKHEQKELSASELKAGIRLRHAWEISIMGEGRQVVLPPSVHPDTGKIYKWETPIKMLSDIPFFSDSGQASAPIQNVEVSSDFPAVDLVCSNLPDKIVDLILTGDDCEDRSAALFTVSIAMLKEGFKDAEILSVLTDRDTFLGQAAFDHAQTKDRKRAAQWVMKYTLQKAKSETLASEQFKEEVETITLGEAEAKVQEKELLQEGDWKNSLDRNGPTDKVASTLKNLVLILKNAVPQPIFRRDMFSNSNVYGAKPPWNLASAGDEIKDEDITNIIYWMVKHFRVEMPDKKVFQAITQISTENQFHPVREYLGGLEWDGVPRIDSWLKVYLGARAPEPYLSAISRKTLCAMVARVLHPGTKYDQVLILEGIQGVGKSTAVRILSEPWFSDAHINIADKDAVLAMRSVWVMELGELSGMRKADVDQLKEFISRNSDRMRVPYGRLAENFPRQCIFIGTTNSSEYLKDETGNRRFWPVSVGKCDFKKLKRDRDQLLAEACFAFDIGEALYLSNFEEQAGALQSQDDRTHLDEWVGKLGDFLSKKQDNFDVKKFTIDHLFSDFGPLANVRAAIAEQMRAASALKLLGFKKERVSDGGVRKTWWVRK